MGYTLYPRGATIEIPACPQSFFRSLLEKLGLPRKNLVWMGAMSKDGKLSSISGGNGF